MRWDTRAGGRMDGAGMRLLGTHIFATGAPAPGRGRSSGLCPWVCGIFPILTSPVTGLWLNPLGCVRVCSTQFRSPLPSSRSGVCPLGVQGWIQAPESPLSPLSLLGTRRGLVWVAVVATVKNHQAFLTHELVTFSGVDSPGLMPAFWGVQAGAFGHFCHLTLYQTI